MPGEVPQQSPFAQRAQRAQPVAPVQQPAQPTGKTPETAQRAAAQSSGSASDWASGNIALDWNQKILAAVKVAELQSIVSQLTTLRAKFAQQLGASGSAAQAQIAERGKDETEDGVPASQGPLRGPQQGDDAV